MDISKKNKWNRIHRFVRPYWMTFTNIFLSSIVTSLMSLSYPYIFSLLIDEVFYFKNTSFFKIIIITYGVMFIGEQLLHMVLNLNWVYLRSNFLYEIRKTLYNKIFLMEASYLKEAKTGDLIHTLNKDTEAFINVIKKNVINSVVKVFRLITCAFFIFIINPKIAIIMLFTVPLTVFASRYFSKKIKQEYSLYRKKYGSFISWVMEVTQAVKDIKLLSAEKNVLHKFESRHKEIVTHKVNSNMIEFTAERINSLIRLIIRMIHYVAAVYLIFNGELSIGGFVALYQYFDKAIKELASLSDLYLKYQKDSVSLESVYKLLEFEIEDNENEKPIEVSKGAISFCDVKFEYTENETVLSDVSFEIVPGELVSIVGESGSGKSTIFNLLLKLYKPQSGAVKIDNQNLVDFTASSIRNQIGLVQQNVLIIDGTIRDNFLVVNENITDEEILTACKLANMDSFIESLPNGLDTILDTDNLTLSGGQKQQIGIARCMLKGCKILILDEATSAIDSETEYVIFQALKKLSKAITVVTIAHRLSSVIHSDRVIVIESGRIVSIDHHSVLEGRCAEYKRLFQTQYSKKRDLSC